MKTTVEIPVEEYEALKALTESLKAGLDAATAQVARLTEQLAWFQRQMFGKKSERVIDMGPIDLIPGFELPEATEETPETTTVPEHERKAKKKPRTGEFELEFPDDLERVEEPIEPPEMERILPDGRQLVRIDEERVEKLAFRPSEYFVKVFVKGIWALPGDSSITPIQEPMPDDIALGSKLDLSFFAHLAIEKFQFHMPIYRVQEKLKGRDIQASRQFLTQNLGRAGDAVIPLARLMEERILESGVIFTDDTSVKVQAEGKCKDATIWVYIGGSPPEGGTDPPYIIYKISESRSYKYPMEFLETFSGLLHGDAFGAYEQLGADPDRDITWVACMGHARRKHLEASNADPDFKAYIIRHIRYLYMFERVARTKDPETRLLIRDRNERPIIDKIFARLKEEALRPDLLPSTKAADAISYMLSREANFRHYLDYADAQIDNLLSERSIRKLAIGRKNWIFFGSEEAGEKQLALFSLIQTCRHLGIKPQEYLENILGRILTHPASRLEELLPDQWKALRDQKASKEN